MNESTRPIFGAGEEMAELISVTDEEVQKAFEGGCPECLKIGTLWVNLRMCLICGKVGCCDSSAMQHASQHFAETGHHIVRSIQPGEVWVWDYEKQEVVG